MASTSSANLTAKCHCTRVSITVPSKPTKINECRCTVCYKLGAMWSYFPRKEVSITITPDPSPSRSTSKPSETSTSTSEPSSNTFNADAPETYATSASSNEEGKGIDGLTEYIREDGEGRLAFVRCTHCGSLTHWWAVKEGMTEKMGVNSRLLPEEGVEGVERVAMRP